MFYALLLFFFVYFGGSGFIVALLPLQPVFVFVYPLHLSEIAFLIFGYKWHFNCDRN